MKQTFLLFLCLGIVTTTWATPHFSRQWSRSTLQKPYYKFRPLNRMSPLLAENLVIQGNAVDGIMAFNRKSGHQQWALPFKDGVEGGAALDGDKIYFGANNGYFYCVDIHSGRILWNFKLNSESLSQPLVQGSKVYHVTGNNTLYAFDKKTGESLWIKTNSAKSNMAVRGQTSPVYEKGVLYLGFSDGTFVAVNAQNGRELWSKRLGDDKKFTDVDSTAILTPTCLLVSSYANALYCLNRSSGSIVWRHDFGGYNSVLAIKDKVYFPTLNGEIHLLDGASGKLLRKIVKVKGMPTGLSEYKNYVIYGESEGNLIVRKQDSLEKVTEFSPGLGMYAQPTVDAENGQVFILSNDSNLYRLDLTEAHDNPFPWSRK